MVITVFNVLLVVIGAWVAFNAAYLLIFALAGRLIRRKSVPETCVRQRKIAVLIPAYREDGIIVQTAQKALQQDYPADKYDVVIIADSLQTDTLKRLHQLPVRVEEVSFPVSTKARAIQATLRRLPDTYDIAFILDADNVMENHCLRRVNDCFQAGFRAVQCRRVAKNLNTATAWLDAASEEINNCIYREGHRSLGLSSALIGSGMGFDYAWFKQLFLTTDIAESVGEDREIAFALLQDQMKTEFLGDVRVYDEKVQNRQVLQKQRTRWLHAYFHYFGKHFFKGLRHPIGNIDYFNISLQYLVLPRSLFVMLFVKGLLLTLIGQWMALSPMLGVSFYAIAAISYAAAQIIALPAYFYNKEFASAVMTLPGVVLRMLLATVPAFKKQQQFIHTPKNYQA
ncbi:glycosyltransferase [Rhodoflexus caldus]|uniref:glycosyltransferase n=1 Tax=Rhodoflexus caldus TaxID=2891236 RepID=UPI00202A144A|nr:glycosyltransferase family 2 protein [Rhodoflexus caldus]